jgi:heme-degrading monooxygenase HmoA
VFVTITTAHTGGESIENAAVVAEEMERWLREIDGFEGFLMLAGEEKALGLSFWADRETAEQHGRARSEFRERILSVAGVQIEGVVDYEVAFARIGPGLAELSKT